MNLFKMIGGVLDVVFGDDHNDPRRTLANQQRKQQQAAARIDPNYARIVQAQHANETASLYKSLNDIAHETTKNLTNIKV